jgi:N-acetylneuraminic acid mutarotase
MSKPALRTPLVLRILLLALLSALAGLAPVLAAEGVEWGWRERAPLPLPKGGVRFLYQTPPTTGGHVFVIHYYVFEYDPANDTWTTHKNVQPTLRPHYAAAALDGKLYAIGGSKGGGPRDWLPAMEEFDPAVRSWRICAPMPGARRNAGAAGLDGLVYVFGGEGEREGAMPIAAYDPRADRWTQKKGVTRVRHCWGVQVVRGKAYIFGASGDEDSGPALLEVYDPATDTISARAPLPRRRAGYATAVVGEKIVVLGGSHGENVPLGEVDVYDPATDSWSIAPDLPRPRCWLGAAVAGDSLFVLGGVAGDFANPAKDMYALDLKGSPLAASATARH